MRFSIYIFLSFVSITVFSSLFSQSGPNLITNGNFETGKIGFSSGYYYTSNNTTEGEYYIGRHPDNWYYLHYPCGDHSSGYGLMLLVNGSPQKDVAIWETKTVVKPGTVYIFSFWLTSISKPNPAELAVYINGSQAGSIIRGNSNTCKWSKYSLSWYSENNHAVVITIRNKNIIAYGNDFAIDDIFFGRSDSPPESPDCSSRIPARFDYTLSSCFKAAFKLQAKKSRQLVAVKWDFGDGKTGTGTNPVHLFPGYGTYKVTAVASSKPACKDTFTRTLTIKPVNAAFSFSEQGQPGKIAFKAQQNGSASVWDFGDGEKIKNEPVVVHQYTGSGDYTATLYATGVTGCRDSLQKNIAVVLPEKILAAQSAAPDPAHAAATQQAPLEKREKEIIKKIVVEQDSVSISLYDNGIIDGDSITLLLDDQVLLTRQLLARTPLQLHIPISREKASHELTMYAENLGSIPPNTALLIIHDGEKRYEVYISSNKKSNGVILFTRNP